MKFTPRYLTLGLAVCLAAVAPFTAVSAPITLEKIAGTYEGWRTETSAAGTVRCQERDEILPDGSFYTWLAYPDGTVATMYAVLTVNADGTIGGPYSGILEIHGRHLSIHIQYDAHYSVHASTHRTD